MSYEKELNLVSYPLKFKESIKNKSYFQLKVLHEQIIIMKDKNRNIKNCSFVNKYLYCQKEDKSYFKRSLIGTVLLSSIPILLSTFKNKLFDFLNNQETIQIKDFQTRNSLENIGGTCCEVVKYSPIVFIISMGYNTLYNFIFKNNLVDEKYENIQFCENILNDEIQKIESNNQSNINYNY